MYIPELAKNLLSVKAATDNGLMVSFGRKRCWLKDGTGLIKAMGTFCEV